jgi:membrane-bound inhibitor of C-type lysozyme
MVVDAAQGVLGMRLFLAALAVCFTPACHTPAAHVTDSGAKALSSAQTFVYECEDNFGFTARRQGNTVWLFLPGEAVQLPQVRSASGEKYQGAHTTFWSEGENAMITLGELYYVGCRNNRSRAIWEHAKLNGVEFRAIGNDPGWQLEIQSGADMVFVADYGQATHRFTTPQPEVNESARKTTYAARNPKHQIVVKLEATPCRDSMSGETFAVTVRVELDGRLYHGCGKPLH